MSCICEKCKEVGDKDFTVDEISKAQDAIVVETDGKIFDKGFAPSNGRCYNCREDIYDTKQRRQNASIHLVTGCPHCCRTYVG